MKKRILSMVLALTLCLSLLPATALSMGTEAISYVNHSYTDGTLSLRIENTTGYTVMADSNEDVAWNGTYYVNADTTIVGMVTTTDDTSIVIADGATLTINGSIN